MNIYAVPFFIARYLLIFSISSLYVPPFSCCGDGVELVLLAWPPSPSSHRFVVLQGIVAWRYPDQIPDTLRGSVHVYLRMSLSSPFTILLQLSNGLLFAGVWEPVHHLCFDHPHAPDVS